MMKLAAVAALVCALLASAEEDAARPSRAERKEQLKRHLETRKASNGERKLSSGDWSTTSTFCSGGDTSYCIPQSYPQGDSICTLRGGIIYLDTTSSYIPSPFKIPSECLPSPGTTKDECNQINAMWNTKFRYCCPAQNDGDDLDYPGYDGPYPQIADASSPQAAGSFFQRPTSEWFADYLPEYKNLQATKWIGKGNKGGCKLWSDCGSNKDKASCKAHGGICVWEKSFCAPSQTWVNGARSYIV